jgi:hypothetical protein
MNGDGWSISAIALHFGAQRMVIAAVINETGPYARQER